ncbi:unnamed protein product [Effrenium voratum]|uniref:Uncharacterized protein n=1 Tax=Effrenium voratum TaxID=2562239 RepID=A0AA36JIY5_9DINO|nr:unnamed protein product [Effrenium voratum]
MGRLSAHLKPASLQNLLAPPPSKTRHVPINASYCRRNCLSDGQVKQRIALPTRTALPGHQTPRTHAFAERFVLAGQLVELSRKLQGRLPWRVGSVLNVLPDIPSRARRACVFSDVLQLHVSKTCCRALRLHASSVRDAFQELARNTFQMAELSQNPVKIVGQITLACWQTSRYFHLAPARGACDAVACVQDMLQGIALAG